MIAATATFALAATEAAAQTTPTCPPETGSACRIDQTQTGEVTGTVDLDVAVGQLTVTNTATGNRVVGGVQSTSGAIVSRQTLTGTTSANTPIALNGVSDGSIDAATQATGNQFVVSTDGATFDADLGQSARGDNVSARTNLHGPSAQILQGGRSATGATANAVAMGGPSTILTGRIAQASQTTVFAETVADVQYAPAPLTFSADAQGNTAQAVTTGASHQDLVINQTNAPSTIEARTSVYVDNAWNLAGRANASANRATLQNSGGSMIADTTQDNQGRVRAYTRVQTNLQGQTTAGARAVANDVVAGNNDIYLKLDNTQLNSGGVEATAEYVGVNGYDSYVSAEAAGNSVVGYACSQCGGEVNVNNTQVNNGAVSATANVSIAQPDRAAVVGSNAVGNTATFYISRPGG